MFCLKQRYAFSVKVEQGLISYFRLLLSTSLTWTSIKLSFIDCFAFTVTSFYEIEFIC